MQSGIFGNSWTNFSGDPVNETTSSVPPVSGRWRPLTIFNPVKEQDRELGVYINEYIFLPKQENHTEKLS